MNTIGILVFTNRGVLEHKKKDGKRNENRWCYWEMSKFPKKFMASRVEELRLYMAIGGQVKGYFIIHDLDYGSRPSDGGTVDFYSESWNPIQDGETLKPSQGWRYYTYDK